MNKCPKCGGKRVEHMQWGVNTPIHLRLKYFIGCKDCSYKSAATVDEQTTWLHFQINCLANQLAQKVVRVCNDCGALVTGSSKKCDKCGSVEGELIEVAYTKLCTRIIEAKFKYNRLADSHESLREAAGTVAKHVDRMEGYYRVPVPRTLLNALRQALKEAESTCEEIFDTAQDYQAENIKLKASLSEAVEVMEIATGLLRCSATLLEERDEDFLTVGNIRSSVKTLSQTIAKCKEVLK